jgi:hypothetical protein
MITRFKSSAIVLSVVLGLFPPQQAFAAEYPPVISLPLPGEPIQSPIRPSSTNYVVKIPVSTSAESPTTKTQGAVSYRKSGFTSSKLIDTVKLSQRAVILDQGVLIGGISSSSLKSTPIASINRSYNEVQTTEKLPTRVTVSNLPKSSNAVVRYYTQTGAARDLGNLRVNKSGNITLPPITLSEVGQVLTIQISAGKITRILLLRVTR